MNKYELLDHDGTKAPKDLKQIKALIDIPSMGVKKGDLGGFIQSENNLSHYGDCWVSDSASVSGSARVYGYNTINRTHQYMFIGGFKYLITVTADSINIGCRQFTFDELDDDFDQLPQHEVQRIKAVVEVAMDQIMESEWEKE